MIKKYLRILYRYIPDKLYLKILYYKFLKKNLNLKNQKTFTEKLQWIKIYDRKPIYTKMVDKYEVREFISKKIGSQYLIPLIGVWEKYDQINFSALPNQFVLKTTHDSGGVRICKDKKTFNYKEAELFLKNRLNTNYFYMTREWPYKNVKPRIICEKYMIDDSLNELMDYKFFCFNGKVKFFKIDFDRFINHKANYYDRNGNLLLFGEVVCPPDFNKKLNFPKSLNKMISLAEIISEDLYFLRVDFYEVNGQIYFGELTFFPDAGFGKFTDNNVDLEIGKLLKL